MYLDMCLDMFRHVVSSSSGDGEVVSLGVQEMESSVAGSNLGSLLRSKRTRRERRCVAASSRLVYMIYVPYALVQNQPMYIFN